MITHRHLRQRISAAQGLPEKQTFLRLLQKTRAFQEPGGLFFKTVRSLYPQRAPHPVARNKKTIVPAPAKANKHHPPMAKTTVFFLFPFGFSTFSGRKPVVFSPVSCSNFLSAFRMELTFKNSVQSQSVNGLLFRAQRRWCDNVWSNIIF